MNSARRDTIPISSLNHYVYCPRRCYLIHAEGEFTDNLHTLRGTREHERVDLQKHEILTGVRVEYALPIWSERLGLTGRCDVVEFHPDGTVYPVEYKHGKRRKWLNDDLQLAAQAICLEEMLSVLIEKGAIFHYGSRRRREVVLSQSLRESVVETVGAVHSLLLENGCPDPTTEQQRCPQCSLLDLCQPKMVTGRSRIHELRGALFTPEDPG